VKSFSLLTIIKQVHNTGNIKLFRHVKYYLVIEGLIGGVWLVMGFIDLLYVVTIRKDYAITVVHTSTANVPFPLGSRAVPGSSHQLLIITAHDN
jgi:hypothetical protein